MSMIMAAWAFVSAARNWFALGALALAIGSGVWLVRDYSARGVKIESLQAQLALKDNALKIAKANVALAQNATAEISARLGQREGKLEDICRIYVEAVTNISPADQECIDPVIGGVLEGIKEIDAKANPDKKN